METDTLSFTNLENAIDQFSQDVAFYYVERLKQQNKRATGNLINSIRALSTQYANDMIEASMELADYWKYVEFGRRPGKMPPVNKIYEWVKQKPVLPRPGDNGKIPTEKQLAFLIARKIGRDGIPAGRQLEDTIRQCWQKNFQAIDMAIQKDIENIIYNINI